MVTRGVGRYLKRLDIVVLAAVLIIALVLQAVLVSGSRPGRQVIAARDGEVLFRGPLDRQRLVKLSGPLGETLVQIDEGGVRVSASPCPFKVCMAMGRITRSGEVIACVPNRLLIMLTGDDRNAEQGYDLISR